MTIDDLRKLADADDKTEFIRTIARDVMGWQYREHSDTFGVSYWYEDAAGTMHHWPCAYHWSPLAPNGMADVKRAIIDQGWTWELIESAQISQAQVWRDHGTGDDSLLASVDDASIGVAVALAAWAAVQTLQQKEQGHAD